MIRFVNVSKTYDNYHALNRVTFSLGKGEMAFLTGHSGAGKSTLLKLIMMIDKKNGGQIFVNDRNIDQYSKRKVPDLRRQIGMIFQNPQLLVNRTIYENVALPLFINRYRDAEIKRRVRAALDKVGLLKKEKNLPHALSTGEQQRIGIARAIVNKPSLVLADEPTGNLDPELSMEIMRLFEAFNNVGVSVLVATHDLSLIAPLNHRIITLRAGELVHGGDHE
jgi:cell division transport system ATP-binding protein